MNFIPEKIEKLLSQLIYAGFFVLLLTPLLVSLNLYYPFVTYRTLIFRSVVEVQFLIWFILALNNKKMIPGFSWPLKSVLLFIALIGLSDLQGIDPLKSYWGNLERMEGFVSLLHLSAMMFVGMSLIKTKKQWVAGGLFSLVTALTVCLLGFKELHLDPHILIQSSLGNSGYLAIYLVIHIFIAGFFAVSEYKNKKIFFPSIAIILIFIVALYNTGSRGSFLGLLSGAVVAFIILSVDQQKKKNLKISLITMFVIILIFAGSLWRFKDTKFVKESHTLSRLTNVDITSSTRFYLWGIAFKAIKEKPLLGWGQENFDYLYDHYYDARLGDVEPWFDRTHNVMIDWSVAGGIIGVLAYLSLFAAAFYSLWRCGHFTKTEQAFFTGMMIAYFIHNLFMFDYLISYILFFLMLTYVSREQSDSTKSHKFPVLIASFIFTLYMGYNLFFFNPSAFKMAEGITRSLNLNHSGQNEAAYESIKEVLALNFSGTLEANDQLGEIMFSLYNSGNIETAHKKDFLNETLVRLKESSFEKPQSVKKAYVYLNLLVQTNDPHSEEVFSKVLALSPKRQLTYLVKIQKNIREENFSEAMKLAQVNYMNETRSRAAQSVYSLSALLNNDLILSDKLLTGLPLEFYAENNQFIEGYKKRGLSERVIEHYKKWISLNPKEIAPHTGLGLYYQSQGKTEEAALELNLAQQLTQKKLLRF
ncbi:MAG: O-antigen ligase family protein [Rhizobacter sp.]|nr:O-antigen ligase family protein [Bacteriovorax sp.]